MQKKYRKFNEKIKDMNKYLEEIKEEEKGIRIKNINLND